MSIGPAIPSTLLAPVPQQSALLNRAGQTLHGIVIETAGAIAVRAGNVNLALPAGAGLIPGQTVDVQIVSGAGGLQARISPTSLAAALDTMVLRGESLISGARLEGEVAGTPGRLVVVSGGLRIPLPEGQQLLSLGQRVAIQIRTDQQGAPLAILSAASKPSLSVSHTIAATTAIPAAHPELVPPVLANKPAAAAQVAALLNQREGLGNVLAPLIRFAQTAAVGGNVAPDLGNALAAVLAPLLRPDAAELPAAIKRWVERATRAHEATLSRAASGQTSRPQADAATAKSVIESMRNETILRQWLTDRGEVRAFDTVADRALDRLNAGQLQQLRSIDHPYWFIDLPFDPESGVNRAMVHLFQDGGRGGDEAESTTVVFDLSLTQLGDIWVKLSLYGDRCACRFGVTDPGVLDLLGQFEQELVDALRSTGARDVSVNAELWDGDRLARTASLMRPLNGVDVSA